MDLRDVIRAFRTGWWIVLSGAVIGGGLAGILLLLSTPYYAATTQFFVSTREPVAASEAYQAGEFSRQRVQSYTQLIMGDALAERVIERLDLSELTPAGLSDHISASGVVETVLINVTVTDESPERARAIAEAVGEEFPELAARVERPEGQGASPIRVSVVEAPSLPSNPVSPAPFKYLGAGVMAGVLLGGTAAVARRRLDTSLREPDEIVAAGGAPVIGSVLQDPGIAKGRVYQRVPKGRSAEDFKRIRTSLQFLDVDKPPKVLLISSPSSGEGKTTTVINLALALAESGKRVTVIDADLRRPQVVEYLGLVRGAGLSNVLAGAASLAEVTQPLGDGRCRVVGSGPLPPNPGELLTSKALLDLVEQLRVTNDYVIFDGAPLLPVADSIGLSVAMDGVLLCVRHGVTKRAEVAASVDSLSRVGARTLGVVLNMVPPRGDAGRSYGYGQSLVTGDPALARHRAGGQEADASHLGVSS